MATNMNMLLISIFMLLILSMEGQAKHSKGPAPIAQPGNSPAPTAQPVNLFPMYGTTQGSLQPQECSGRCTMRCSATAHKKPCMFFCQKCCATCLCVPPGTYGNKQFCPCYNNWKTEEGRPKCP